MTPLKYWVFPRVEIERLTRHNPLPLDFLKTWEAARPGVLSDDQQDVFAPNSRSHRQSHVRYDLFERVESAAESDFLVCQNWLELCLAGGVSQNIQPIIDAALQRASGKPCLFSWNHDTCSNAMPQLQSLPTNAVVLNYNCRMPSSHDLLLPFWNVNCLAPRNDNTNRQHKASFIGQASGELRRRLKYAFANRPGYSFSEQRRPEAEYIEVMRDSWFTLCPRGGGLSSYRLYEAIQQESVPILFADEYVLPFQDDPNWDWACCCIRIPERLAGDIGAIETVMNVVNRDATIKECQEARRSLSLEGVQLAIEKHIREMLA